MKSSFKIAYSSPLFAAVISIIILFLFAVIAPVLATAQQSGNSTNTAVAPPAADPKPIQDNSFLIEEGYNQEFGVVQHINTFVRDFSSHNWAYAFTQEWPIPDVKHQISYTLSAIRDTPDPGSAGFGDLAINYRYQLLGDGDARVAFAPRVSLLAPTGDPHRRRGAGAFGVQSNLPLSVVVNKHLVTHWNVGTTIVPRAKNNFGERATTYGYNLGQSFVWLAHPRFNVLLETVWAGTEQVAGAGRTQRGHDLLISPGIRWAHNFKNGLQIVPGIGVPMGVGPSAGEKGIFLYLSFEHPFRSLRKN